MRLDVLVADVRSDAWCLRSMVPTQAGFWIPLIEEEFRLSGPPFGVASCWRFASRTAGFGQPLGRVVLHCEEGMHPIRSGAFNCRRLHGPGRIGLPVCSISEGVAGVETGRANRGGFAMETSLTAGFRRMCFEAKGL